MWIRSAAGAVLHQVGVFDEGGVKAGCLDVALGGRDPPCAGPQPDVLLIHIKPLTRTLVRVTGSAAELPKNECPWVTCADTSNAAASSG